MWVAAVEGEKWCAVSVYDAVVRFAKRHARFVHGVSAYRTDHRQYEHAIAAAFRIDTRQTVVFDAVHFGFVVCLRNAL